MAPCKGAFSLATWWLFMLVIRPFYSNPAYSSWKKDNLHPEGAG